MSDLFGGKYILERAIGRGGMGIVWMARDQRLGRRVAIKILAPESAHARSSHARLEQEAKAIARLRDPHVVQIHDYGFDRGAPFIVMELLEGEDLETRLHRSGRLSLEVAVSLIRQTARGLDAAHEAGLVHCDLKPANLFLARAPFGEVVKILDFGVAAMLAEIEDSGRRSGAVGTPVYMSPEQLKAAAVDRRSDLWSLGVVAYEAITGRLPFEGLGLGQLWMKICGERPAPPSGLVEGLPKGVDDFFERALAKDPAQRFPTARALADAFASLLGAGPPRPINILVVDDEPDLAPLVQQAFRPQIAASRYAFSFADDGGAALEVLHQRPDLDLVITDLNMPGMGGLALLGRITEAHPDLGTIILTAYGVMSNVRTAMNRGAFDFLTKPIDFDDLEATIEKTFRHVVEARRGARSSQENDVLRMCVSPRLGERIRLLGAEDALGAEALEGAVAELDVCGAAEIVRQRPPGEAVRALNANFEVFVPTIEAHGGVVHDFARGSLVAAFLGPGHLERAIDACTAVRAQIEDILRRTGADSPCAAGVRGGVAAGSVVAAGLGSRAFRRVDYALLGDAVATASRLSRLAGKGQILIDEATRAAAGDALLLEPIDEPALFSGGPADRIYNVIERRRAAAPLPHSPTRSDPGGEEGA
jgi:CheY-like chemotaxis protein